MVHAIRLQSGCPAGAMEDSSSWEATAWPAISSWPSSAVAQWAMAVAASDTLSVSDAVPIPAAATATDANPTPDSVVDVGASPGAASDRRAVSFWVLHDGDCVLLGGGDGGGGTELPAEEHRLGMERETPAHTTVHKQGWGQVGKHPPTCVHDML